MLYNILMAVHLLACLCLIGTVLFLQSGRGAGLNVFGGGGDSLINSPSGSSFIKKATAFLAGTFAFTSLFLTLLGSRSGMSSVTSKVQEEAPAPVSAPAPVPTK
jgi:protein translocase SecG subunit